MTKDVFDSGMGVLRSYYPTFQVDPTAMQQWRKATAALSDDEFIAAIDTWIADSSEDSKGQVRSKYAPTAGELMATAQRLGARRHFQKTKEKAAEAMGDTPSAAARSMASLYNQPRIKEQLKRGNDIRRAMAAKYRLDYRLPDSYGFLMAVLKEAQGAGGLCSKDKAMRLAEGLEGKYLPAIAAAAAQTQPAGSIDTFDTEDAPQALTAALDTGGI